MRRRIRLAVLVVTALMPGALKRIIYRLIFGYRIHRSARIGFALLDCQQLTLGENSRIGTGTVFWSCGEFIIGNNVEIGFLNLFRGGARIELEDYSKVHRLNVINAIPDNDCTNSPVSRFRLGWGSVITAEHRIDFTDSVEIGRHTTMGGRNSSIWTHNRREGLPVVIGEYCYLGSEIRMAPGARVPDCCIVGIGSVVTRPIYEGYSLIAGVPATRKRALSEEDHDLVFGKTRSDLPELPEPLQLAITQPDNVMSCGRTHQ